MASKRPVRKKNVREGLVAEFAPWMIQALAEHVAEGCSVTSFHGRYKITQTKWLKWIKEIPELAAINAEYRKRVTSGRRTVMPRPH